MTRVCLIGEDGVNLQYELLSRETSREALATYDLERPFENALAVRTVSVGAAVSLLNDLQWYLTRFVEECLVREPSIDDEEWLSRRLAEQLRNGEVEPEGTGEFCKVYGLETPDTAETGDTAPGLDAESTGDKESNIEPDRPGSADPELESSDEPPEQPSDRRVATAFGPQKLVEPLYVRRTDGDLPEYDLRDVEETLVVRLTEAEFTQ
ncbi:hypothetical protein HALLA_11160 [Halostagnicola larsenii XH-48]|uniref:Uncharacterized protein n=1 Tax=Halostagnicola larsenii XH-48 TaxID=797299 RepID=W0JQU6_9EURY|nr:DUF5804 family protein [Halostagnicola larsenii]AHF99337.1 hypothetical protein HALLA_11160 [Halostagnicola larsenii XH-48]